MCTPAGTRQRAVNLGGRGVVVRRCLDAMLRLADPPAQPALGLCDGLRHPVDLGEVTFQGVGGRVVGLGGSA
ncbi:MAG TPA: hypothetical protein VHR35_17360 [Nocardioides sp.]|jgi:hypothetical protein|nr:hypothetical protein [Nocardioides sp.]